MGIIHRFRIDGDNRVTTTINDSVIIGRFGNVDLGYFVAETCARYMDAFIPMDTGMLAQNYVTKPFKVTYTSLYAKRMYYGTNLHFNKEKHPNATAKWDEAMMRAKGNQLAREVKNYLNRRNGV